MKKRNASPSIQLTIHSVWRPLSTVKNAPLILSDRRTVFKRDLIEVDQIMPDIVNKTAFLCYCPSQKYYWLAEQRPEEVAIFATWAPPAEADHAGVGKQPFRGLKDLSCIADLEKQTTPHMRLRTPTIRMSWRHRGRAWKLGWSFLGLGILKHSST